MGSKIYVGNLSYDTSRETLDAAFGAVGQVSDISMPTDRETGRLRGFAFVTMASPGDATAAIEQLDGSMLDGRPLRVNEAHDRPGGGGGGRGGRY